MRCDEVLFSAHAIMRMFERAVRREDVTSAILSGETIAEYADDQPYPSYLLLWFVNQQPLHVVVARDEASYSCYIVTVYVPDRAAWELDFKTRKQ
jgi:hypothetical protein